MANEKRLIDANALKQHLLLCGLQLNASTLGFVNKRIDEQPTVEAVEVVHGVWEMAVMPVCGEYNFRCSVCTESFWRGYSYPDVAHYCPNCGANMINGGK